MSQITDKKSHLYLLHYMLHLIWIMILYDVDMCICSFFSLVASVYIEVSQICCTCFWLFFVRRMTNICSEVMIFNFFEREKLDSNTRCLLMGEKNIKFVQKPRLFIFYIFSAVASVRKWAKLQIRVSLKSVAPDFDYPLYVKQQMLNSSDLQKKELDSKATRTM